MNESNQPHGGPVVVPTPTFDLGPANVRGDGPRGNRARVLWFANEDGESDYGTLVIVLAFNNITKISSTMPTKVRKGYYTAQTEEGKHIHLDQNGCATCGWNLRTYPIEQILEVANGQRKSIDVRRRQPKRYR